MLNICAFVGRIVREPELNKTKSDVPVCSFAIAVDRRFKSGEDKQTDFINCVAWRGTAEFICKYFKKGEAIAIRGSLQSRQFTDKEDKKRTAYEVMVEEASFTGSKSAAADSKQEENPFADLKDAGPNWPF